jgi:RecB family endonuclease NucS
MKLFTLDQNGKLTPYKERSFSDENRESDLENILEENPEYFFEDSKILIIGRQVPTNLGTTIDLLGIDKNGDSVVIELKRRKTPRETIAQLLEYAAFVENLSYEQLNEIFQTYNGEETTLDSYHQEYFALSTEDNVAFNKSIKHVIVAQDITSAIIQTALYLRKKGLDLYCMEFKYFLNKDSEKMITSDFIVGDESFIKSEIKSETSLPKTNENKFIESLDKNGKTFFIKLLTFSKENNLVINWGSKGFSVNLPIKNGQVALCFGYPPDSVFKQSIYSGFEEIRKKIKDSISLIDFFKSELKKTNLFIDAKSNLKLIINRPLNDNEINQFTQILTKVIARIRQIESND